MKIRSKIAVSALILSMICGCSESKPVELSAVTVPTAGTERTTAKQTEATEVTTEAPTRKKTEPQTRTERKLKEMSLQEKICQMFIAVPESIPEYSSMQYMDDWFRTCYDEYPIGGFIYFESNLSYDQQVRDLLSSTQECALDRGIGVFQAVDEEGGSITRVQKNLWTTAVNDMNYYGELNDFNKTYEAGKTIGTYLEDYGFNLDFAPVADVKVSETNELGNRIFSSDPIVVSDMCSAIIKGLHGQNIFATLKHFPGLGAGEGNTHYDTVHIERTKSELERTEFLAFKGGIDAGADFVMVGHQITSASRDMLPGDLSPVVIQDWLRDDLEFDGIVITDSQSMGAITNNYTSDEAAILAVEAGADMILMPNDLRTAVDGLKNAVTSGRIKIERINESVLRILEKKDDLRLLR